MLPTNPRDLVGKPFLMLDTPSGDGRIQVWQKPRPDRTYVIGADFAYGIGRDWDAACIFDKTAESETGKAVQVAEAQGQWGPRFASVLYGLHVCYNQAFILGERQVGLFVMRMLWDEFGVRHMYRQKAVDKAAEIEGENPALGWHRQANDLVFKAFRLAVKAGQVELRSLPLIDQMIALQYVPTSRTQEDASDDRLKLKVRTGGSPDLTMAAAYGHYALGEVVHYEQPKPLYGPNTYGQLFGFNERHAKALGVNVGTSGGAKWVHPK